MVSKANRKTLGRRLDPSTHSTSVCTLYSFNLCVHPLLIQPLRAGSFKLYVMVASVMSKSLQDSPHCLLKHVLEWFGSKFDWEKHSSVQWQSYEARCSSHMIQPSLSGSLGTVSAQLLSELRSAVPAS